MEEVGKILKDARLKLNLSIDDITNKTKMHAGIIENIESGNTAYFDRDLTYLRYYLKSYANAVFLDYSIIEDLVDDSILSFTQNIEVLKAQQVDNINKNINSNLTNRSYPNKSKAKLDLDWTLLSLISIIVLIVAFLLYSIFTNISKKQPEADKPPVVELPDDNDKDDKEDDIIDEIVIKDVEVNSVDANTYKVTHWQKHDDFNIKVEFNVNTWVMISVNNQVINIPNEKANSKTYLASEQLVIEKEYYIGDEKFDFQADDEIKIRFGIVRSNKFFVNNKQFELDEAIANNTGGTDVIFKLDVDVD